MSIPVALPGPRLDEIGEVYRGRSVLITGHTGFKGGWLASWLAELGAKVTGYALPPPTRPSLFDALGLHRRVRHVEGDVRDFASLRAIWHACRPEVVFHLAAQAIVSRSFAVPLETVSTNVLGTTHVMELARQSTWPISIVCVTSDKCYENVESVYGYRETDRLGGDDVYSGSKAAAEMIIHSYRRSFFTALECPGVASARAGNVIGGGDWSPDRLVPDCVRALAAAKPIALRHPAAVRPWQHVLEALSGYLTLGAGLQRRDQESMSVRTAWNFGPAADNIANVDHVVAALVRCWGGGDVQVAPGPQLPETTLLRLSIDKAQALLPWRPRWRLAETVEHTVEWYRAYYAGEDMTEHTIAQISAYAGRKEHVGAA